MTTLSATMNAKVTYTYKEKHTYSSPPFPLEQCGFSRARADLETVFIFANPALQQGDTVALDQLQLVPIKNSSGLSYYFLDRATATLEQAADTPTPATEQKRGYVPDVPKDDFWQITRDMFR